MQWRLCGPHVLRSSAGRGSRDRRPAGATCGRDVRAGGASFNPPAAGMDGDARAGVGRAVGGLWVDCHRWAVGGTTDGLRVRSGSGASLSGPIGLGFRVPLVIASPWSRGGFVNSQVCDHTSIVQMLEKLLSHRTGKPIRETNISAWRRAICGNLSCGVPSATRRLPSRCPVRTRA